jgi:hypothetical protein
MRFADYYRRFFRNDLAEMLAAVRPPFDRCAANGVVRPVMLSTENAVVCGWPDEGMAAFGAALFLTILADQVCYTHFRSYDRFRQLTNYPKLMGDPPGGTFWHIHPSCVFPSLRRSPGAMNRPDRFPYHLLPADTVSTMEREVHEFVQDHMPELGDEFWRRCDAEIPPEVRLRLP